MKRTLIITCGLICVWACLLLLRCIAPNAGNATQTGNAITAMLCNPGGSPAAHATVRFYPVRYNPRTGGLGKTAAAAVDSTTTDANGNYTAKLDTGTYNILASGDSGVVYQDSITVSKDSTVHPPADTLNAPGSIRGVIRLQPGDDARKVFIIAMGTNVFISPEDSVGNFVLANMAEGTYRVRMLSLLDNYGVLDNVPLTIKAGKDDTLSDTVELPFTGIPVPAGVKISYDTMMQIVTLCWNRPVNGRPVSSYTIYRKRSDSASFVAIKAGVTDTSYNDSTGVQDQIYDYRVAAVDTNTMEGTRSGANSVTVASAFPLVDSITLKTSASGARDFVIGKDSLIYVTFQNDAFVGVFSTAGDSIRAFGKGMFGQLGSIGMDSREVVYVIDPNGNKCVKFSKNGDSLSQWSIYYPTAMEIDTQDNIYVVYANGQRLARFDTAGTLQDSVILSSGSNVTFLAFSNDGSLFTGDGWSQNVMRYDQNLSNGQNFTFQKSGNLQYFYQLQETDENRNLFFRVEDNTNATPKIEIHVFNPIGEFEAKWTPYNFFNVLHLARNRTYTIDGYGKIKIFSRPNL